MVAPLKLIFLVVVQLIVKSFWLCCVNSRDFGFNFQRMPTFKASIDKRLPTGYGGYLIWVDVAEAADVGIL